MPDSFVRLQPIYVTAKIGLIAILITPFRIHSCGRVVTVWNEFQSEPSCAVGLAIYIDQFCACVGIKLPRTKFSKKSTQWGKHLKNFFHADITSTLSYLPSYFCKHVHHVNIYHKYLILVHQATFTFVHVHITQMYALFICRVQILQSVQQ